MNGGKIENIFNLDETALYYQKVLLLVDNAGGHNLTEK